MVRHRVIFRGRVQGVGFRYTAMHAARGYEVCGFVRNLADGSVEVVAEGEKGQLEAFLGDLTDTMSSYIIEVNQNEEEYVGEFESFEVRY